MFQGPRAYISPSLYATKQGNGRVVPTYNYSQNQPEINRASVESGLRAEGGENALAMADAVARH